ncbi:MAG: hypothetical protein HC853_17350 [Anaerolineae bacterium]|nr:hypothetical protein [Anaerolineae bacterium]
MLGQDLLVRPATEADADAFREMRLEALRNHPEAYSADYDEQVNRPHDRWAKQLTSGNTFVACDGDKLVGMAGIYIEAKPKPNTKAISGACMFGPTIAGTVWRSSW